VIDRHEGSVRSIVEIDLDFVFDCRADRVGVSDVTDEGLTDVAPNKLGLGLWLWCLRRLGRGGFILGLSGGSRRRVGAARCCDEHQNRDNDNDRNAFVNRHGFILGRAARASWTVTISIGRHRRRL